MVPAMRACFDRKKNQIFCSLKYISKTRMMYVQEKIIKTTIGNVSGLVVRSFCPTKIAPATRVSMSWKHDGKKIEYNWSKAIFVWQNDRTTKPNTFQLYICVYTYIDKYIYISVYIYIYVCISVYTETLVFSLFRKFKVNLLSF